jgi:hypothetical protein
MILELKGHTSLSTSIALNRCLRSANSTALNTARLMKSSSILDAILCFYRYDHVEISRHQVRILRDNMKSEAYAFSNKIQS